MTAEKRAYYATRKPAILEIGRVYENEGGGFFRCQGIETVGNYFMQNVKSGWSFIAHGVGVYIDSKIDWDYSTGGCFAEVHG